MDEGGAVEMKQQTLGFDLSMKKTRKRMFLEQMEVVVPWRDLVLLIAPHRPVASTGRPPFGVETLLRIHLMQQWFGLGDQAMEESLHDMALYREFAGLDGATPRLPDESTLLGFRHLLETHGLAVKMLGAVNARLQAGGFLLKTGSIVDATLIAAPSSTKNEKKERDPEMHSTKKGNQWHFGMKAHIGVDAESGLVHTVKGTSAEVSDVTQGHALLHGEEEIAFGDAGYQGIEKRPEACASQPQWHVALRPSQRKALDESKPLQAIQKQIERIKSGIRAKVEHPFQVMKCQFGYRKVRYRGLAKNTAQITTLMMLVNLWMMKNRPLPVAGQFCLEGGG